MLKELWLVHNSSPGERGKGTPSYNLRIGPENLLCYQKERNKLFIFLSIAPITTQPLFLLVQIKIFVCRAFWFLADRGKEYSADESEVM